MNIMYVRCTESKTSCFEVGGIYTVDHLTGDELNTRYIKDDHGDAWRYYDCYARGHVTSQFGTEPIARFVKW